MAYVETAAAPVDACYLVKCDNCGKTTWKVRSLSCVYAPYSQFMRIPGMRTACRPGVLCCFTGGLSASRAIQTDTQVSPIDRS